MALQPENRPPAQDSPTESRGQTIPQTRERMSFSFSTMCPKCHWSASSNSPLQIRPKSLLWSRSSTKVILLLKTEEEAFQGPLNIQDSVTPAQYQLERIPPKLLHGCFLWPFQAEGCKTPLKAIKVSLASLPSPALPKDAPGQ